jgi:hypothetical protein
VLGPTPAEELVQKLISFLSELADQLDQVRFFFFFPKLLACDASMERLICFEIYFISSLHSCDLWRH